MGFPIGMLQNKSNAHLDSWALQSGKWQVRTASQTGPTRNITTTPEATTKEIGTDGLGHTVFFKVAWSVTQLHCATLAATSCPWTRGASRQKMTTPYLVPSSMAKQAFRWFGCLGEDSIHAFLRIMIFMIPVRSSFHSNYHKFWPQQYKRILSCVLQQCDDHSWSSHFNQLSPLEAACQEPRRL